MKSVLNLILLATVAVATSSSCFFWKCIDGEGKPELETRQFSGFTEIDLNLNANLELVQTQEKEQFNLEIVTHKNLMEYLETEVVGEKLIIKSKECLNPTDDIKLVLEVGKLSKIKLNGSGDIFSNEKLTADDLSIQINGSGDISLEVSANNVQAKINGSGDCKLTGNTNNFNIGINGSGDLKALEFMANMVDVSINGSGDCQVQASQSLNTSIKGSGDVVYSSTPEVKTKITGSGSVSPIK